MNLALPQFHDALHAKIQSRLRVLHPHSFFADEVFERISKGRKMRSLLFTKTAETLKKNLTDDVIADVCLTIEMPHAASVLVDDILDGDDIRHGYLSSNIVLGTPTAVLESHFLCAEALKIAAAYPTLLDALVDAYRKTAIGELYDIFAVEPIEAWIEEGYSEKVFQKTSSLFEYAMIAAASVTGRADLQPMLRSIGLALGRLYQMSNDYHDLQIANLRKRHSRSDVWRITYSYPLALYINRFGKEEVLPKIEKKMLSYVEWRALLTKIWIPEIKRDAWDGIQTVHNEVLRLASDSRLPKPAGANIHAMVESILQEEFWYHSLANAPDYEDPYAIAS